MEELKCKIGRVWNYSSISSMYQNSVKQCRVSKWKINQRLTLHFKVPRAVNHRICINLAHIPPSIQWLYSLQMQKPLVWRWSWKWNSWISSYHVVMDCKYSLSINTNPCNLQSIMALLFTATKDSKNMLIRFHYSNSNLFEHYNWKIDFTNFGQVCVYLG